MKKPSQNEPTATLDAESIADLEAMLEQVILTEVTTAVWDRFEDALRKLDPEGLDLLEQHLDGVAADNLSSDKLSKDEAERLVTRMKRDLVGHLRKDCKVRH